MNVRSAISAINRLGICLVFPKANEKAPLSLWRHFFPKTKMRWEWDDEGDSRVADLWHLREELSRSGKVVYVKWYQGRATFFSKPVFAAFVRGLNLEAPLPVALGKEAIQLLGALEETSPLSTKQLKAAAGLQGKFLESTYTKNLKQLWNRLLIVGYGEVDDGAFPSLAMGATQHMFEDLWNEAYLGDSKVLADRREQCFSQEPLWKRQFERIKRSYEVRARP